MRPTHYLSRVLIVIGLLAAAGCGGGSEGFDGPTEPPPGPPPPPPGPPGGPAPVGYAVYAVDLDNRLILFGTESMNVISRRKKITGLPILNRIVGIDFRPSNGKLYGVGNDSRVYLIDTATAQATPVSSTPFSPKITTFFEVHFGNSIDPRTERMRLIATESGANWSINLDDGTAVMGKKPRYAEGGPHAGEMPLIIGLAYEPPGLSAADGQALRSRMALSASGPCEELMYAISAKYAELIGSCDPDEGDFTNLGPPDGVTAVAGCGELTFQPGQPGGLWQTIQKGAQDLNKMGYIDENGIPHWTGNVANDSPIQGMAFAPGGPQGVQQSQRTSAARSTMPVAQARAVVKATSPAGGLPACPGS